MAKERETCRNEAARDESLSLSLKNALATISIPSAAHRRQAIREHLPDEAHTLLSECSTEESQLLCVDQQNPMATTQRL